MFFQNQTHTATALQVFYNLGCLHIPIEQARMDAEKNTIHNIKTALDTRAILKRSGTSQASKGPCFSYMMFFLFSNTLFWCLCLVYYYYLLNFVTTTTYFDEFDNNRY